MSLRSYALNSNSQQLRGKATEPLAEELVVVIRCVARRRTTTAIRVPAAMLNQNFMGGGDEIRIDSDIPYPKIMIVK